MKWRWGKRTPSDDTVQATEEKEQARERLQKVELDDETLKSLTMRTQRLRVRNNFASDIKRALGGTR
jgi:hypothetical protein